jgi:hypothetical protein
MTTKEQHEQNLLGFIDLIKSSMSDIGSFKKSEISSYFLMMRKFFENYVNENNEKYSVENSLYIKSNEAENINHFFNVMIEMFEKSNSAGYIHEMTVLDRETLVKIGECYRAQMVEIQMNLKSQYEIVGTHNAKIDFLLKEIGVEN